MSHEHSPLPYLNSPERRLLGPLVCRLSGEANPRVQRALETTGPEATARMACVNALRIYAAALFTLGVLARLAGASGLALGLYGLATAAMAWSFWCLYTVARPEREFKHSLEEGSGAPPPAGAALEALARRLAGDGASDDRAA